MFAWIVAVPHLWLPGGRRLVQTLLNFGAGGKSYLDLVPFQYCGPHCSITDQLEARYSLCRIVKEVLVLLLIA